MTSVASVDDVSHAVFMSDYRDIFDWRTDTESGNVLLEEYYKDYLYPLFAGNDAQDLGKKK